MFQKYMERDSHSASHPTCGIWTHFRSTKVYSGGRSLCQNPQLRPQRTQAGRDCCFIRHRASCAEDVVCTIGGSGRNRTSDTWIFSPLLLPAELLTHIQDTNEIFVGIEPTTDCLTDNYSTNWVKIFSKEKIAECAFMVARGEIRTHDIQLMRLAT